MITETMNKYAEELTANDAGRAALLAGGLSLYNDVPADIKAAIAEKKNIYNQLQEKSVNNINKAFADKLNAIDIKLQPELDLIGNRWYNGAKNTLTGDALREAEAQYHSDIKRLEDGVGKERMRVAKEKARAITKAKAKNILMSLKYKTPYMTNALKSVGKYGVLPAGLYLGLRRMYNPDENVRVVRTDTTPKK